MRNSGVKEKTKPPVATVTLRKPRYLPREPEVDRVPAVSDRILELRQQVKDLQTELGEKTGHLKAMRIPNGLKVNWSTGTVELNIAGICVTWDYEVQESFKKQVSRADKGRNMTQSAIGIASGLAEAERFIWESNFHGAQQAIRKGIADASSMKEKLGLTEVLRKILGFFGTETLLQSPIVEIERAKVVTIAILSKNGGIRRTDAQMFEAAQEYVRLRRESERAIGALLLKTLELISEDRTTLTMDVVNVAMNSAMKGIGETTRFYNLESDLCPLACAYRNLRLAIKEVSRNGNIIIFLDVAAKKLNEDVIGGYRDSLKTKMTRGRKKSRYEQDVRILRRDHYPEDEVIEKLGCEQNTLVSLCESGVITGVRLDRKENAAGEDFESRDPDERGSKLWIRKSDVDRLAGLLNTAFSVMEYGAASIVKKIVGSKEKLDGAVEALKYGRITRGGFESIVNKIDPTLIDRKIDAMRTEVDNKKKNADEEDAGKWWLLEAEVKKEKKIIELLQFIQDTRTADSPCFLK